MSPAAKWLLTILILGLLHLLQLVIFIANQGAGEVFNVFPFGNRERHELAAIAQVELWILALVALAFVILLHRSGDN